MSKNVLLARGRLLWSQFYQDNHTLRSEGRTPEVTLGNVTWRVEEGLGRSQNKAQPKSWMHEAGVCEEATGHWWGGGVSEWARRS